jgi:class 3 adenylate cyclase/YHS domain-containing protein
MSVRPEGEVNMDLTTEVEVTFLIADLAGFTALTETHGNLHAAHVVTRFLELVRATLQPGARLMERVGDAVLIVADDTVCAVRTAIALHDAAEREPLFPLLRIGVHGGPVVQLGDSYFGTPLNLTARLASYAKPDQILCTERVAQSGGDLPDVEFRALGPVRLKNIAMPVAVFQVMPAHRRRAPILVDPVCRMRVSAKQAPMRFPFGRRTYHFCSLPCAQAFAEHPDRYAAHSHARPSAPRTRQHGRRRQIAQASRQRRMGAPFDPADAGRDAASAR